MKPGLQWPMVHNGTKSQSRFFKIENNKIREWKFKKIFIKEYRLFLEKIILFQNKNQLIFFKILKFGIFYNCEFCVRKLV